MWGNNRHESNTSNSHNSKILQDAKEYQIVPTIQNMLGKILRNATRIPKHTTKEIQVIATRIQ